MIADENVEPILVSRLHRYGDWAAHCETVARLVDAALPAGPLRGVEIGVGWGLSAMTLLQRLPRIVEHMMVDEWWTFPPTSPYFLSGDIGATTSVEGAEKMREEAEWHTRFASHRRRIVRMRSAEAALRVVDGTLDYAFVDGDHSEEGVHYDLIAWTPKLRPGGLLFGHDYHRFGVRAAVDRLAADRGWRIETHPHDLWSRVVAPEA